MTVDEKLDFKPDWTSPPGETIKEILCELYPNSTTQALTLSLFLGITKREAWLLFEGRLTIDEKLASALGGLRGPASFWLNLERNYRRDLARLDPTHIPQADAEEAAKSLDGVFGEDGPKKHQNTFVGRVKEVCERLESAEKLLGASGVAKHFWY